MAVYNAAFVPLATKAHPTLMGKPFYEGFPKLWGTIKGMFLRAEATGIAAEVDEMEMIVERGGFQEESHFTGNFIPVRGDTGAVEGYYNSVYEVTKTKINDRRRAMLNQLQVPTGQDTRRLANHVLPALTSNPKDIPMAMIYKTDEETNPGTCILLNRGSIGIPKGHPLDVTRADIKSDKGLMPLFRKARSGAITVPVDEIFDGVEWSGFGVPSKFVSVIPIKDNRRFYCFLAIGTNPRRPIDEDHHQFIRDLSSQITAMAVAIISNDEAKQRAEQLERELAASLKQRQYMAENASFGIASFSPEGKTIWANDQYYAITDQSRAGGPDETMAFIDVIIDEDQYMAVDTWNFLINGGSHIETELRLKRLFTPPTGLSASFSYSWPQPPPPLISTNRLSSADLFPSANHRLTPWGYIYLLAR